MTSGFQAHYRNILKKLDTSREYNCKDVTRYTGLPQMLMVQGVKLELDHLQPMSQKHICPITAYTNMCKIDDRCDWFHRVNKQTSPNLSDNQPTYLCVIKLLIFLSVLHFLVYMQTKAQAKASIPKVLALSGVFSFKLSVFVIIHCCE